MASAGRASQFLLRKLLDQYSCWFSRGVVLPVPRNTALSPALDTDQVAQRHEPCVTGQQHTEPPDSAIQVVIPVHDLESQVSGGLGGVGGADPPVNIPPYNFDWASMVIGLCLTCAVEIALQSLQLQIQIPLLVHLLSLALVFAFSSFFVSNCISTDHPRFSHALVQIGKLSFFLAFFLAITVPFSLFFEIILWSICVLSLLAMAYVAASSGRLHPRINFYPGARSI